MISKELLSEVLGLTFIPATGKELLEHSFGYAQGIRTACVRPLKDDEWITIKDNVLTFGFIDLRPEVAKNIPDGVYTSRSINIYEFANECKEWAFKNGYALIEKAGCVEVYYGIQMYIADTLGEPYNCGNVFKACQWILDNKDK